MVTAQEVEHSDVRAIICQRSHEPLTFARGGGRLSLDLWVGLSECHRERVRDCLPRCGHDVAVAVHGGGDRLVPQMSLHIIDRDALTEQP